jgi:hypothetical protein
MTPANG